MGLALSLRNSQWTHSEIVELSNKRKLRGKQFIFEFIPANISTISSNEKNLISQTKNFTVNAFLNIPFGKAPIGELRFKVKNVYNI